MVIAFTKISFFQLEIQDVMCFIYCYCAVSASHSQRFTGEFSKIYNIVFKNTFTKKTIKINNEKQKRFSTQKQSRSKGEEVFSSGANAMGTALNLDEFFSIKIFVHHISG